MSSLMDFLRARLDEDEQFARAAADCHDEDSPTWAVITPGFVHNGEDGMWSRLTRVDRDAVAEHMARFDPARVLREIETKRRIISEHSLKPASGPDLGGYYGCETCYDHPQYGIPPYGECPTLKLLALPYVDHPDYDEVWRP